MKAAEQFELNPDKKTVLIFGGSQGSAVLNKCTEKMTVPMQNKEVQVLWQTGENNYESFRTYDSEMTRVIPFIEDMTSAYAMADLVLSRAGAVTIAELTACGLPSILVPLPHAAADHQTHNALSIEKNGAAETVTESQLNAENLAEQIITLIKDDHALSTMAQRSRSLGKPEATSVIVDQILERVSCFVK